MSGAQLPDDSAQTTAYENGRAAGSAAISELQRAAPRESAHKAWLLGFLEGAIDAARHSGDTDDAAEWLKSEERLKSFAQSPRVTSTPHPAEKEGTRAHVGIVPRAVRVSAVDLYGHSSDGHHEWLSVAFDADEHSSPFAPGSSLALWPTNEPEEVRRILRMLEVSAQLLVHTDYGAEPAWQVLLERVDLSSTPPEVIQLLADFSRSDAEARTLLALAESPPDRSRSLAALLRRYPGSRPPLEAILKCLSPLKPSYVPIASSFLEASKSLLVTVESTPGETGWGQVSDVIRSKLRVGEWLSATVDEHEFPAMLAADDLEPAIIIAEGSCVALARAFAAERHERQAKGRTWVIVTGVGTTQFPYARAFSAWHRAGSINRFDVAPGFDASDILRVLGDNEENLWRWFVDHSRLFVITRRPSTRAAVTEWFVGLIARRYKMGHEDASERLHELSEQGRWVMLPLAS